MAMDMAMATAMGKIRARRPDDGATGPVDMA
jgi:hypothetical protein